MDTHTPAPLPQPLKLLGKTTAPLPALRRDKREFGITKVRIRRQVVPIGGTRLVITAQGLVFSSCLH